jgi:hypothetical protein
VLNLRISRGQKEEREAGGRKFFYQWTEKANA